MEATPTNGGRRGAAGTWPRGRRLGVWGGLLLSVWILSGIRSLDPSSEIGVVDGPLGLFSYRTERSLVVVPPGLFRLSRYPSRAIELPLPQAEEVMLFGPNGTRVGFRGHVLVHLRQEAWRKSHEASGGHGLEGVLRDATIEAGEKLLASVAGRGSRRPALARELEVSLTEALAARGVDLRRLSFSAMDYLAVPEGSAAPPLGDTNLLIVGWDGADWEILDPLLAQGRMPNLARLVDNGSRAKLLSISPTLSPVVWTTIATGVEPSRHGILDFLVADPATGEGQPVTSVQRKAATFWEILSHAGGSVGVTGWWATWPADPVNGYLVADRIAYQLFGFRSEIEDPEGKTWPPDLYEEIRPRIVSPGQIGWEETQTYLEGSRRKPEDFDTEEQKLLEDFRTLVASGASYFRIGDELRRRFRPRLEIVYFESTDTVGHLFMPYRSPLLEGVDPGRYESFRSMVDRYYETADRYLGELLEDREGEWTVMILSDHGFVTDATRPLTTDSRIGHGPAADWHRRFGVLVLSGDHVLRGARMDEASVYDIAPTVLALFGQPVPSSWPGRVLGEALDPAFLSARPVRFRQDEPPRGDQVARESAVPDPAADELREKLRSLGYIGSTDPTTTSVTAANNTGVALMAEGKYSEAADAFRAGLEDQPGQPSLLVNLGLALRMLGEPEKARPLFEQAMTYPVARRMAGHQLAQLAMTAGDLKEAEDHLRRVLEAEPGAADVRNTLGLLLEKTGKLDEAIAEYSRASRDDANAAQPRNNLGNVSKSLGDLDDAESWYLQAIEADPYFMGAYNNLALVYQERGELQKAIDLYARALSKAPANAVVLNNLASLYYAQGDHDEARRLWVRSIQADPSYPSPMNNLGGLELGNGRLAEAEELLGNALELDPNYGDARMNLALLRRRQGKLDRAREELRAAAKDPRSRARALAELGYLELQEGNAERALAPLLDARTAGPKNLSVLNALGETYLRLGREAEAAEAWRASLVLSPGQADVRRRLEELE